MQDKDKVTLYLPTDLHRQLKIRSAVDGEPMSALAERAIVFYLTHSEVVDGIELSHGHVHQVYNCPECTTSFVLRDGEPQPLARMSKVTTPDDEDVAIERVGSGHARAERDGEEELVPC
jgi:hypothetical protein